MTAYTVVPPLQAQYDMTFKPTIFRKSKILCIAWGFILSSILGTHFTQGAEPANAPQRESIDDLVQEALERNAELRSFEAEVEAAKGRRTQAGLWKNPEVSGEYGSRRVKDSEGAVQGEGTTRSLSIAQTFEFPGKGTLRKAIADKDVHIAELGLEQFRLSLAGQIRILAFQYQAAAMNAVAAEEVAERSSGLISLLKQRPTGGTQPFLELRVIEASLIELHSLARESIQERDEARLEINRLLGRSSKQDLILKEALRRPDRALSVDYLIQTGLSQNMQLRARTMELEKAINEVSAAKLDVAPNFSIGPFYSLDRAGEREENFGGSFAVTFPLWDWNQGNIHTAKAHRDQADALLLDARRKVEMEIARRFRAYELARRQLEQMPGETVKHLQDASELADRQYRTGAIGVQLFLEVQRQFLNSQRVRNNALLDAWRHLLDLELLIGSPLSPSEPLKQDADTAKKAKKP